MSSNFYLYLMLFFCISNSNILYADENSKGNPKENTKENVQEKIDPPSTIESQYENEKNLFLPKFSNYIALYKPTYILPFYYTKSPDYGIYKGLTPNNERLNNIEFKAQLSLYLPLIKNLFYNKNLSINIYYTQLIYWQLYSSSPWFRETNYEPVVGLRYRIIRNIFGEIQFDHESNGRGGDLERSWNRLIFMFEFSTPDIFIQLNGWLLLFQPGTSKKENPKIGYYLGYDKIILSYRILKRFVLSVEANNIESGYSRGFYMFSGSYPLTTKLAIYLQYFNGYGQSLIEYNHRTQSFGVGISLNDWQ